MNLDGYPYLIVDRTGQEVRGRMEGQICLGRTSNRLRMLKKPFKMIYVSSRVHLCGG